ncbi:MAG: hypothetical protein JEZ12_02185 [Desulfobacterium sp.]|nr:hypothetical protein [Desulfobacterium sp.]
MLNADLDLEADLGIDTVKQVEIFAKVSAKFGLTVPEDLKLRNLNTAAKLAHYIADRLDAGKGDTPAPATTREPSSSRRPLTWTSQNQSVFLILLPKKHENQS